MVDGSTMGEFCSALSQTEVNHTPVSFNSGSRFIKNFSNSLIPNFKNPVLPLIDLPNTRNELCDAVLKCINQVLMEDDEYEDEVATATGISYTLDATKRSFHELLDAENIDSYSTDKNKKCPADSPGEYVLHEMFGKIVLLDGKNEKTAVNDSNDALPQKGLSKRQAIDMKNLLLKCMDLVGSSDYNTASKLLIEIRSQAWIYGDATQRLAHYLAEGLEARFINHEVPQHNFTAIRTVTESSLLKAFKFYLTQFPFTVTSYFFANEMIMEVAEKANTLHIIHFGIMHGFQWPPFIQRLSKRPGGPPKLRITAIDFPQSGFRPDARVKETCFQLSNYCKEHKVPFEYNFLSTNWDAVKLDDLKLKKREVVAINCMYYFQYLIDDTIMGKSPRDVVLNLMRSINPAIFVHVVTNGAYGTPLFASRSREALFHYLTWFDMFDTILPRNSLERMVFEKEVLGRELLNVIASEGLHRKERPEMFKQWQKWTKRAGFKPIPLNPTIVNEIRARVKLCYHKDFFVDESGPWLLDGWKGRSLFALSCWKPAKVVSNDKTPKLECY